MEEGTGEVVTGQERPNVPPPVDAAFVQQTLFSVAGFLRLVQKGFAPSAEEAAELEERIARILPFIMPPTTDAP